MPVPLHGQVAVTGTAQPLSSSPVNASAFSIKAPLTNANPVYLGASGVTATTGHWLDPGDGLDYEHTDQHGSVRYVLNISDFYVVGTSPDRVSWFATP